MLRALAAALQARALPPLALEARPISPAQSTRTCRLARHGATACASTCAFACAFACAAVTSLGVSLRSRWTFRHAKTHTCLDICPACCRLFYRTYTYTVRGVAAGSQINIVQLGRADANNANNNASATATVLGTCANPFGNGTKLTCPATKSYTGPDGRNISSSDAFGTACCVSVQEVSHVHTLSQSICGASLALSLPPLPRASSNKLSSVSLL